MINKNIVLIGFMGCGKTSIGKELAQLLNLKFLDVDEYIEKKHGCSISEIFQSNGECYFRKEEEAAIEEVSKKSGYVIATGGGAVLNNNNIINLKSNGQIIYLKADIKHIFNNVKNDINRPLLQTENPYDTIKKLLESRKDLYEKATDITVDVTDKSIPEIVECIVNELHKEEV